MPATRPTRQRAHSVGHHNGDVLYERPRQRDAVLDAFALGLLDGRGRGLPDEAERAPYHGADEHAIRKLDPRRLLGERYVDALQGEREE